MTIVIAIHSRKAIRHQPQPRQDDAEDSEPWQDICQHNAEASDATEMHDGASNRQRRHYRSSSGSPDAKDSAQVPSRPTR